jgi:ribosomal protein S3
MTEVMNAGAMGIEILITGKIPSSRAKSWRFYRGYLKKCGDIALTGVGSARTSALLKTGIIGIKVKIMPPDTKLPDDVQLREEPVEIIEEIEEGKPGKKARKKPRKRKKAAKKPAKKKKDPKEEEKKEKAEEEEKTEEAEE